MPRLVVHDAGRLSYADGLAAQENAIAAALAWREARSAGGNTPSAPGVPGLPHASDIPVGTLLLLEHDPPVITVSRRPDARAHLLASPEALAALGVELAETDRGGDITYHGPGQLVAYPILDLNALGWNLHRYMRELEAAVIRAVTHFGVQGHRDACATGVWVGGDPHAVAACATNGAGAGGAPGGAKICAMGVRVRRWISAHGLALNVTTNLDHFSLIVPCGLAGRPVTSLERELGPRCPRMVDVKAALAAALTEAVTAAIVGGAPAAR